MRLLASCIVAVGALAFPSDSRARPRSKQARAIENLVLAGDFSKAASQGQTVCERRPKKNTEVCILAAIAAYRLRQWTPALDLLDAATTGASTAQREYIDNLRSIFQEEATLDADMTAALAKIQSEHLDSHSAAAIHEAVWSAHQASDAAAIAAIDQYVAARDYPAAIALYERARWTVTSDSGELSEHAKVAESAMARIYENAGIHLLGEGVPPSLAKTLEQVAADGGHVRDIELGVAGRWTLITDTHVHWSTNAPTDLISLIQEDDRPSIVDISLGTEKQWIAVLADGTIRGFAWTSLIEKSDALESSKKKITSVDIGLNGNYALAVAGETASGSSAMPEASLKAFKAEGCDDAGVVITTFGNGSFLCLRPQGGIKGYFLPRGIARLVAKLPPPSRATFAVDGSAWAMLSD